MQIKKAITLIMAVIIVAVLTACGGAGNDNNSSETVSADDTKTGGNVLILYFSADNTKDPDAVSSATPKADDMSSVEWIAEIIHEQTGGETVPIIPSDDYPLEYEALADHAEKEADDDARPEIEDLGVDPQAYDTVYLGYPIWWYTVPKVIETMFEKYDFTGVNIIPFNTHAGSGDGGTYELIKEREPSANVLEGLAVAGDEVGEDDTRDRVIGWLEDTDSE